MIAADYLAALKILPLGQVEDLTGGAPFLVLSPHADDETLGCGGLLALAESSGIPGHVVILTDGAKSHPRSQAYPPARLVPLREAESAAALATLGLGPDRLAFLGLPDAAAPLSGPLFDDAVAQVVAAATGVGAQTLFVTWGQDPHCDHKAAFAIAREATRRLAAVRLWAYPIWGWHLKATAMLQEDEPTGFRLAIDEVQALKRRALACYPSQMTRLIDDDPNGFSFSEAQLAPFVGPFEYFVEVR